MHTSITTDHQYFYFAADNGSLLLSGRVWVLSTILLVSVGLCFFGIISGFFVGHRCGAFSFRRRQRVLLPMEHEKTKLV